MTKTLTKADLLHFTGSETWYRHGLARDILYTDGAQYVAEQGGAYWLRGISANRSGYFMSDLHTDRPVSNLSRTALYDRLRAPIASNRHLCARAFHLCASLPMDNRRCAYAELV